MCQWHIMPMAKYYKNCDGLIGQLATYQQEMKISYRAK
jgi:hypothetical protein